VEISKERLLAAAQAAGIEPDRAQALWQVMAAVAPLAAATTTAPAQAAPAKSTFNATSVAYYFGGFLIIGAMTFFMAEGWAIFGGGFAFAMSIVYAVVLAWIGYRLYRKPDTRTPGGILVTAAVCMMPLAIYSLEELLGVWQQGNPGTYSSFYTLVHGSWIWMELTTIAAGIVALRFVRFPLITLPIAFAFWFLSMDGASALLGKDHDFDQMRWLSLWFGIAMIAASIAVDRRTQEDYAFWGYLYGTIAFYGGLSLLWTDELHKTIFVVVCLAAIAISIVLGRRVLMIFGTFGVAGYLGDLAFGIFNFSLLFPFVLTALGLGIVFAGIWYQRNEARIRDRILALVPARVVAMLPTSRAA
jgi:hypothetical protein